MLLPSENICDPTEADQDGASACGTEYPESEVSFGDYLPQPCSRPTASPGRADQDSAEDQAPKYPRSCQITGDVQSLEPAEADRHARHQKFNQQDRQQSCERSSQPAEDPRFTETQYPDIEESLAEDFRQPADNASDAPWSEQDQMKKDLPIQAQQNTFPTDPATAGDHPEQQTETITGTQYPDWEDDESACPEADAEPCPPDPELQQATNALQDGSDNLLGNCRGNKVLAATQYPDIEADGLPSPNAAHKAWTASEEAPQSSHSPLDQDAEDDEPLATQYPDIEDEGLPCEDAALPASGRQEAPESSGRGLQMHASEDEVPAGTQYPDLDEEDSLSQSQLRQPGTADPEEDIAPDAHSDFDAELDDFLAEQVFLRV